MWAFHSSPLPVFADGGIFAPCLKTITSWNKKVCLHNSDELLGCCTNEITDSFKAKKGVGPNCKILWYNLFNIYEDAGVCDSNKPAPMGRGHFFFFYDAICELKQHSSRRILTCTRRHTPPVQSEIFMKHVHRLPSKDQGERIFSELHEGSSQRK